MNTIRATQAKQLSELMERECAIAATVETVTIHGLDAVVVILDHVDREDDGWQSVHVIDYMGGKSVSLGNLRATPAPEELTCHWEHPDIPDLIMRSSECHHG